jgi:hypothetical protein
MHAFGLFYLISEAEVITRIRQNTKMLATDIRKTISSAGAFLAFLAIRSLLKGQKYKGSLSNA